MSSTIGLGSISKAIQPRPRAEKIYIKEEFLCIDSRDRDRTGNYTKANNFRVVFGQKSTAADAVVSPGKFDNVVGVKLLEAIVPVAALGASSDYPYIALDIEELRGQNVTQATNGTLENAFAVLVPSYDTSNFSFCRVMTHKVLWKEPKTFRQFTISLYDPSGTLVDTGADSGENPSLTVQTFFRFKIYSIGYEMVFEDKPESLAHRQLSDIQ
jgi:hypothetical protein